MHDLTPSSDGARPLATMEVCHPPLIAEPSLRMALLSSDEAVEIDYEAERGETLAVTCAGNRPADPEERASVQTLIRAVDKMLGFADLIVLRARVEPSTKLVRTVDARLVLATMLAIGCWPLDRPWPEAHFVTARLKARVNPEDGEPVVATEVEISALGARGHNARELEEVRRRVKENPTVGASLMGLSPRLDPVRARTQEYWAHLCTAMLPWLVDSGIRELEIEVPIAPEPRGYD